jgi:hypothetical protein
LRSEFSKPVDVRDFTWSATQRMEQQDYSVSLIAIDWPSHDTALAGRGNWSMNSSVAEARNQ